VPAGGPRRRRAGVLAALLAALLLAGGAIALAMSGGDDPGGTADTRTDQPGAAKSGANAKAKARAKAKAKAKAKKTPAPVAAAATPEPTPEPTTEPTPEPTPTATEEAAPSGGNAQTLNDQGFTRFQAGDYAGSVPYFRRAVSACGSSTETTCAYATYNLGAALNRSGDPASAIPFLQQRLERWPNDQPGTVRAELQQACQAAGQDCG
jgi:tetratricopeptide (TPR) repeat protein